MKIGVIGAGQNARGHARYYQAKQGVEVVSIADPQESVGKALADEVGSGYTPNYRAFLDVVDAVVISSPNFLHAEHALGCVEAGKHIYCEKPMGLNLTEAELIAQAVREAGVCSAVGFTPRLSRESQTIRRRLERGLIGEVISVWSRRLMFMPDDALTGWRADPTRSGGLLMEINVHELDWMMMLAGPVESVYAQTRATATSGERANDHLWITLQFANGAVGHHEGSWRSATPNFFKGIHGSLGGAVTDEWGNGVLAGEPGGEREPLELEPGFDLRGHWIDCIQGQATPECDAAWGLEVMRVAEAVFISAASGQPVRPGELSTVAS